MYDEYIYIMCNKFIYYILYMKKMIKIFIENNHKLWFKIHMFYTNIIIYVHLLNMCNYACYENNYKYIKSVPLSV